MKRLKKLSILLAVLVVVCVAAYCMNRYEEHKEEIKNTDEVILAVENDDVNTLSLEYSDTALSFHKSEDGTWLYDGDEAFPVDADAIDKLISVFNSFGASFIIENVDDFSQYGLDDPTCTIKLTTADNEYSVQLGSYSTMDQKRYVSTGDGNVYLTSVDPFDTYEVTLPDMIKHDELPKLTEADSISFEGVIENTEDEDLSGNNTSSANDNSSTSSSSSKSDNLNNSDNDTTSNLADNNIIDYTIYREDENTFTYCADDIYFTNNKDNDNDEILALDTSKIKSYLSTVGSVKHTDYVTYNASDDEISTYGLDDPELTVNISYTTQNDDKEDVENSLKLDVSTVDDKHYLRINDSQIIYSLSTANYTSLISCSYDDLRHDDIFTADFADVNRIDVSLEEFTYTFTTVTKDDKTTFYYNDEEISIDDLKSALTSLTADSFTDEEAAQKEEISITLYLDNDVFPQTTIKLYRYDGSTCLAAVDGKSIALVPRSQTVDIIEAVNSIVLSKNNTEK